MLVRVLAVYRFIRRLNTCPSRVYESFFFFLRLYSMPVISPHLIHTVHSYITLFVCGFVFPVVVLRNIKGMRVYLCMRVRAVRRSILFLFVCLLIFCRRQLLACAECV